MENQNKDPEITVLITVYNGEKYLEEAILSILNQTFGNFELIIVNDGSTDGTKKIIRDYLKKDKRIIYLENKKNKGYDNLHNIINKGLKIARGKYVARMDADDISRRERLEVQYKYLEKNKDIFLVGCSAEIIDRKGTIVGEILKKPLPSVVLKARIAFSNPLIHSSIFFRNEKFMYINWNEHFFYFNLLINGKKLKNIRRKLIKYRINPEGLMSQYADLEGSKYWALYREKIR
ncbi:MAG: glycosyltransferase family A protein [Nanoarchaeota archaeon]|nr:glycosyltransferase family A protein [Nanoarchaeota archaeon]